MKTRIGNIWFITNPDGSGGAPRNRQKGLIMEPTQALSATCGASSAPGCAADMFETTSALIGNVTEVENGWEVAFAPDCTTWITVRRDEHDEPKVGDFITVTVPKVVAVNAGAVPRRGSDVGTSPLLADSGGDK